MFIVIEKGGSEVVSGKKSNSYADIDLTPRYLLGGIREKIGGG